MLRKAVYMCMCVRMCGRSRGAHCMATLLNKAAFASGINKQAMSKAVCAYNMAAMLKQSNVCAQCGCHGQVKLCVYNMAAILK